MRRKFNKRPKFHIKKGDVVKVLSGNEDIKGKVGEVLKIFPKKNRAIVQNLNIVIRNIKPNQNRPNGDRVEMEASMHISKLQLVNPTSGKPSRVRYEFIGDKKVRKFLR